MRWIVVAVSLGLVALLSNAEEVGAANFDVTVGPMNTLAFSPATTIIIGVGNTVTWNWSAENVPGHTTTECGTDNACNPPDAAPNAIWDSSPAKTSGSFGPIAFNTTGTFPYRCNIHPSTMRGEVVVLDPAADEDSDTVPNGSDNCPLTPNADQLDTDGDSLGLGDPFGLFFRDGVEVFMGTNPVALCSTTSAPNDEAFDAFGPDFDDSQEVEGSDVILLAERFGTQSGIPPPVGLQPYSQRFDIFPTGTSVSKIDGSDVIVLATYFGATCV